MVARSLALTISHPISSRSHGNGDVFYSLLPPWIRTMLNTLGLSTPTVAGCTTKGGRHMTRKKVTFPRQC